MRALTDQDLRGLFEANNLVVVRDELLQEHRELGSYLDLAGCTGPERERAEQLAPGHDSYTDDRRLVRAGETALRLLSRGTLTEHSLCPSAGAARPEASSSVAPIALLSGLPAS